jgi:hypothetical protein
MLETFFLILVLLIAIASISGFVYWNVGMLYYEPMDWCLKIPIEAKMVLEQVGDIDFRTGDILLFSGTAFGHSSLRALTRSYFDHCSMVVKDEFSQVYIWESDIGQNRKMGARVLTLEEKLKHYKGNKFFVHIPYVGKDMEEEILSDYIQENIEKPLRGKKGLLKYFISYDFLRKISQMKFLSEGKFCSELIFETLQSAGVVRKDILASSITPKDFLEMKKYTIDSLDLWGKGKVVYF